MRVSTTGERYYARKQLTAAGAKVKLQTYEGGHGWHGDPFEMIRAGIDWLESQPEWDKKPPPPKLPPAVVQATTERYLEIFRRLTGVTLDDFQPPLLRGVVP